MNSEKAYHKPPVRVWEYTIDGKWTVLAGRTDADNDRLSLKEARPNDWWFHVRGMPGSHVLLKALPDEEPGKDDQCPCGSGEKYKDCHMPKDKDPCHCGSGEDYKDCHK